MQNPGGERFIKSGKVMKNVQGKCKRRKRGIKW